MPDFSGNVAVEFELWLEDLEDYLEIVEVTEAGDKKRYLLNIAGLSLRKIVKGLTVGTPGSGEDEYTVLKAALKAYFRPSVNSTSERHKFRQMKQQPGESVTAFVGRLREKVELCEFDSTAVDTVVNGQIRDQLIAGLVSAETRKQLLMESKLTLGKAIEKAVALEASVADSKLFANGGGADSTDVVGAGGIAAVDVSSAQRPGRQSFQSQKRPKSTACKYCGGTHPWGREHCPAAHARCRHCSRIGHYASVCLLRKRDSTARTLDEEHAGGDSAQVVYDMIYAVQGATNDCFTTTLLVDGRPCKGLLDTGATRTILTSDIAQPTRTSSPSPSCV